MITEVEGREFKTKRCVKGWARWAPVSEAEKAKFQELVLCLRSDHNEDNPRETDEEMDWSFYMVGWWVLLQRFKLPRPHQATGTNFVCLKRSDRWRLMQPNAGIP